MISYQMAPCQFHIKGSISMIPYQFHINGSIPVPYQMSVLFHLLVSQYVPQVPAKQVHVYLLMPSVQTPLFWHGMLAHSFISGQTMKCRGNNVLWIRQVT